MPRVLLAVLYLLFFAGISFAQDPSRMRKSPVGQQIMKSGFKETFRTLWEGQGATHYTAFTLLNDPIVRTAWGISDEQHRQIQAGIQTSTNNAMKENPELAKLWKEWRTIQGSGIIYAEEADEETMKKVQNIMEKMGPLMINASADGINSVLTPEQKQKIKESQLANMGEMPILSPNMFEALGLTDPQKQQMEKIKKEFDPEFKKILENYANGEFTLMTKMWDTLEKEGKGFTFEDTTMRKKLMDEDPEYKKLYDEIQSQGRLFATKFKIKMFDVLTDEQWTKLQKLIDDPPEYAKAFGKKLKELSGENEQAGAWQPGPNSWKPGEAIPEEYRQQRNTQRPFPRAE